MENTKKELEKAKEEYNNAFNNLPPDLDFNGYNEAMSPYEERLDSARRKYALKKEPEYKDIPEYGDHMKMEDFVECCKSGGFIDYDGGGNYATEDKSTNISIYPSDVMSGDYRKDFSHVIWFNR